MEGAGCALDTEARFGLAKKKRLSLRGCGASRQPSGDVRHPVSGAVDADDCDRVGLDSSNQERNILNFERLDDRGRTTGIEVFLLENTQTRSENSEGRHEERVSSVKVKDVIVDEFADAEEELPFDVLEEVLSQYDKPVAASCHGDNQCELDTQPELVGGAETTKCMAVESLVLSKRACFEEYDVSEEGFKSGFLGDDEPVSSVRGSIFRYEDAADDPSAFQDDLFIDEDASIRTALSMQGKADSQLEETPCGIADNEDLSFRDAFYKGGTDWSSLHEVDEYGLPYTSSPPSSCGRDCASENAECSMEEKVVRPQLSSQSRHSRSSLSEPSLYNNENNLRRSLKLKQGDLSSFLGFKRKSSSDASVTAKKAVQRNIGTYFGLAPLAKQASAAANFLSKFRPGYTLPVAASGRKKGWKSTRESTRSCPFYKKMPGTPFTVDAFKFGAVEGCKAYFLSHFHSDHYGGLTRSWSHGPIFCTEITARLVSMHLGVDSRWLRPVQFDSPFVVEGVEVKFLEANHCPGAALILFQTSGQLILHTGDFRACKGMQAYPDLLQARITSLYLDTTYCNPKYNFPLQEDVIRHVVRLTMAALARNPRTLVAVGAYSIGKERVYLGIAKALKLKIYADKRRARTLRALDWPDLTDRLCSDASSSKLHVLPISHLNATKLRAYMQSLHPTYSAVLAFRPTGWTYSEKVGSNLEELRPQCSGAVTIFGVPYSEHSSYSELQEFVQFLRPQKIIATVNIGSAAQRESMQAHFNRWLQC